MGRVVVIDASVTLEWLFDEGGLSPPERDLIDTGTFVAPPIWRLEVVNALLSRERRGLLDAAELDG